MIGNGLLNANFRENGQIRLFWNFRRQQKNVDQLRSHKNFVYIVENNHPKNIHDGVKYFVYDVIAKRQKLQFYEESSPSRSSKTFTMKQSTLYSKVAAGKKPKKYIRIPLLHLGPYLFYYLYVKKSKEFCLQSVMISDTLIAPLRKENVLIPTSQCYGSVTF